MCLKVLLSGFLNVLLTIALSATNYLAEYFNFIMVKIHNSCFKLTDLSVNLILPFLPISSQINFKELNTRNFIIKVNSLELLW